MKEHTINYSNITLEIIPESIQFIRMSDKEYFSEKYKDYISNSKLGLLNPDEGGSEEKFFKGFNNDFSESFELGTTVHNMLLQKNDYKIASIRKPSGKLGVFMEAFRLYRLENNTILNSMLLASENANYYSGKLSLARQKTAIKKCIPYYIDYINYKESTEIEELYLSEKIFEKYTYCMANINKDKVFYNTIYPEEDFEPIEVYNEYAILAEIKLSGDINKTIKVKGKIDNCTINFNNKIISLNDVKTTGKPSSWFMGNKVYDELTQTSKFLEGSFQKYHYYRQIAMYLWLLQNYVKHNYKEKFTYKNKILLIETIPEYKTKICNIEDNDIIKGLKEFKKLFIDAARII